jgi:uncharacterized protein (TIGR03067 family)
MHWQLLTAVLVIASPAEDKKKNEEQKDEEKLQRNWVAVSYEHDGKAAPEEKVKTVKMVVKDDAMTFSMVGLGKQPAATFKLDPKKEPKAIDVTPGGGDGTGKKDVVLGIYELDGDKLKICLGIPGKDRPTAFATKEGERQTFITCKREKKD